MRYYIIEGIDTSGKTTQCTLLKQRMQGIDFNDAIIPNTDSILFVNEPSNTNLGREIRNLILHSTNISSSRVNFFLFLAQRAELFEYLDKLENIVVSDRSFLSGIAYSDYDIKDALSMNLHAIRFNIPKKIVMLHISSEELEKRLSTKKLDNVEKSGIDNLLRIQDKLQQAIVGLRDFDVEIQMIDSSLPSNLIHENIYQFFFEK